jgi:DNA end-binding protein Ku
MAARSIASLTISFGLVSIPVKLYSATQSAGSISFNLLHKSCGSRLRQQYVCIREDVVVERSDMVKGYEFAPDQYVAFTPEELKALEEKGTGTIEISEFLPAESIDPVYYDRAYYLAPDKGGTKPYALLIAGMRETEKTALARWAARGKQYLVQLRAVEGGLVMQQLLYAPEVRSIDEVAIPEVPVKEQELRLAKQLIEQISSEKFEPDRYEDDVKKRIEAAIETKVAGKEIEISPEERPQAQIIDLVAALRASLEAPAGRKPARAPAGERDRADVASTGKRGRSGTNGGSADAAGPTDEETAADTRATRKAPKRVGTPSTRAPARAKAGRR